jgi:superfamily II DNA or RNA helicase
MFATADVISKTRVEPRPYQGRIVGKALDMFQGRHKGGDGKLEPNARSILIESPTGSGKTVMGWLTAKCLQILYPDMAVGWVAMRRNLLSQAACENADFHPDLNPKGKGIRVNDAFMTSMFEREPERLLQAKKDGRKILLVVDEAQHDAANSMAHLHNIVEPDFILGLSATPFRTDRVKLCFDKVIKDAGIHQLIQDGYLSRYHHYSIPNWNPQTVAETYLREPERWGKSIFYFVNLEDCRECLRHLKEGGIVCDLVTGDTDVESQLEAFAHGKVPALVNCMKLTEGFDAPDLQTAFVRDSGKGSDDADGWAGVSEVRSSAVQADCAVEADALADDPDGDAGAAVHLAGGFVAQSYC